MKIFENVLFVKSNFAGFSNFNHVKELIIRH